MKHLLTALIFSVLAGCNGQPSNRMSDSEDITDWKLKLRYGQIETDLEHFTAIADGRMTKPGNEFDCPVGPAVMAMKTWAANMTESGDMIRVIGDQIGFVAGTRIEIYKSEPEKPPTEKPTGYDINFTPYTDDSTADEPTEQAEDTKPDHAPS